MKPHLTPRDLALIIAVVVLWGFSFVPIKVGLNEMPPFGFVALRFFFAAVPLVFFIKPPRMPLRYVVAYGLTIGVCQFGLLFLGMNLGMPAGLSSLVIQLQVFFTIGLGMVFLGDPLRRENAVWEQEGEIELRGGSGRPSAVRSRRAHRRFFGGAVGVLARGRHVSVRHRTEHDLHAERGLRPHRRVERDASHLAAPLAIDHDVPEQIGGILG